LGSTIGAILGEAVGVAISPVPIIAVVLLLSTPKGKANALSFLAGWLVGLGVIGAVVLVLADPTDASSDTRPATWVGWMFMILGVLLVLIGVRAFRNRPKGGVEPPLPKWMAAIDGFTPGRALVIGFALAALNPKNLALTLAAAATIASAGLATSESYIVLAVFVVIGTLGLAVPVGIYFLGGDKAAETLGDLRHWLAMNNSAIMSVLCLVIGSKLIGNGMQTLL
jgi:threonine/homoserine/homoserine lactone efflux protein